MYVWTVFRRKNVTSELYTNVLVNNNYKGKLVTTGTTKLYSIFSTWQPRIDAFTSSSSPAAAAAVLSSPPFLDVTPLMADINLDPFTGK